MNDAQTNTTTTAGPTDQAHGKAQEFVSSLPSPSDRPDRHDTYARLGMVVMVIGFALSIVAMAMSQASDNPLDQSTQISMGIAGLAAVCFGGIVFLRYSLGQLLRFWLLRILHEQHSD